MLDIINIYINKLLNKGINDLNNIFITVCEKFATDESNNINGIKFILADRFEYYPDESEIEEVKKLCEERDGQNQFRHDLILRDKKCLITGDNHILCEACHIIPYSKTKSYDISNGLLLNRCLHKMFDEYLFSINPETLRLEFNSNFFNFSNVDNYLKYNNIQLHIHPDSIKYLHTHWENFILRNDIH